jgi:hypothetical protein
MLKKKKKKNKKKRRRRRRRRLTLVSKNPQKKERKKEKERKSYARLLKHVLRIVGLKKIYYFLDQPMLLKKYVVAYDAWPTNVFEKIYCFLDQPKHHTLHYIFHIHSFK